MAHGSRCAGASGGSCRCSCGGSLHGGHATSRSTTASYIEKAEPVINTAVTGIAIPALVASQPQLIPIYTAYQQISFGKRLYSALEKAQTKNKLNELNELLCSKAAGEITEKIVNQVSDTLFTAIEASELDKEFSLKTGASIEQVDTIFKITIKNTLTIGMEKTIYTTIMTLEQFLEEVGFAAYRKIQEADIKITTD